VQGKSVDLSELTLPSFTDSIKQVELHFIRDLGFQRKTPGLLKLPPTFTAVQDQ
jgi:hypothetical protein